MQATTMNSRQVRRIRRSCQRRSQNRNGLGVSELFTAHPLEARRILSATDARLKQYLLGYDPMRRSALDELHGWEAGA